jgi:NAD(P)-dependent dehydrogenase (short-subunit alcohol dehydrogenase family)
VTTTAADVVTGLDLSDKTAVITGATSGLGLETARVLASAGATVILAGRGLDRLAIAAETILESASSARLASVDVELGSQESIRAATASLRDGLDRIDLLINNAGVMMTPFGRTADGFETQFGINHLGHFVWTTDLLPLVAAAPGARIVNLTSAGHGIADLDLDDPNWERREYDKFAAYGAAKTANILFTVALDARYAGDGVRSYAVHPGLVATSLGRYMDGDDFAALGTMLSNARSRDARSGKSGGGNRIPLVSPAEGAATQVWAAVAPELADVGGVYLADCGISTAVRSYATDAARAAELWATSELLCAS